MLPGLSDAQCAQLDQLLDQLIDAAPAERVKVLSALQLEQSPLHAELVQMLAMAEQPAPALDPERIDRRAAWHALAGKPELRPELGERIGAWRLLRHLGRGGMGEVYEVARADGAYEQRAALKLILAEIDSRDFLERFARERQILAELNHPGIARLFDGGEDARGRQYLVMEFVSGSSIEQYCAAQCLDLRSRLQLFLQVAAAVEHAHRQRVVHRDIKPSNIIVTADGAAKLLDFGIAKVLSEQQLEPSATRTSVLLTPQYSTPEQVLGKPADYRSDIYQLGLLLFELLTTKRAQEPVDGTPHALLRAVCVDDRPAPSTCVTRASSDACTKVGNLNTAAWARQLRGDVDWIVQKALRQDPMRRYASVQAFSDDVQRYLQGAPVLARPETLSYRAGKFVRLHPWGVASTAAVFVLLAVYALTATYLLRANATQARISEQVKSLVLRMFETANPQQALGRELTAKQLLDLSWPLIESETKDQPRVQVELLNTLGETYRQLGDYEQALSRLQRAEDLIEAHAEFPSRLAASNARALGQLLTDRGDYEQAEAALQRARVLFETRGTTGNVDLAATLKDFGHLQHRRGRETEAEGFYLRAIETYRQAAGDQRRAIADASERLAISYGQQSKYQEAGAMLASALVVLEQLLPVDHPDIAGTQANLAEIWRQLGKYPEAEALFGKSLASVQRTLGPSNPHVATTMNNFARVLKEQGKFARAEELVLQGLAIRRERLGERNDLVAMSLNDLGHLYLAQEKFAAAEQPLREALAILPAGHMWSGAVLSNLGRVLEARRDLRGAERLFRQALAIRRDQLGAEHDLVASSLQQLGVVLQAQARYDEADASLREALRILRLHLDVAHPRVSTVTGLLARLESEAAPVTR
jgi:eukaryotic-like serine/threonine-protein kinase